MQDKQAYDHFSLEQLSGVGTKVQEKLARLKLRSLIDLLFHLPIRYEDRTSIMPINRCTVLQFAQIDAHVVSAQLAFGKTRSLIVTVADGTGHITLRFFHFNASMRRSLSQEGQVFRFYGQVRLGAKGLEMMHPEFSLLSQCPPLEEKLTPVYALTEGLGQKTIARLVRQAFDLVDKKQLLTDELRRLSVSLSCNLGLFDALKHCHYPDKGVTLADIHSGQHPAMHRLALEELVAHRLCLMRLRLSKASGGAPILRMCSDIRAKLLHQFGFELTPAQARVEQELMSDLARAIPMMRLVQGDVGSGKTAVAALSIACAVASGFQAALMAPTEVLAEQHAKTLSQWFEPMGYHVVFLSGQLGVKAKRDAYTRIASSEAMIVVGTHALFQKDAQYQRLGLVVIDEQHRFGVNQRYALCEKGRFGKQVPHQLIMTATPIPRTMAMTAFAELDHSVIDQIPKGRSPIKTLVMEDAKRPDLMDWVRQNHQDGGQIYWVCPLIEESEVLQCQAAEHLFESLQLALPEIKIGLVHGRMPSEEKVSMMAQFKAHELSILVATTVIEVGVDVPNANMMIIEGSERLGLSQLHQLRGRVGRGSRQSFCVLLYKKPLGQKGQYRLKIMRDSVDGFHIAEKDLELRGSGEFLGTKQAGVAEYKIADALRDQHLLPHVKSLASASLAEMSEQEQRQLIWRWLGDREHYTQV